MSVRRLTLPAAVAGAAVLLLAAPAYALPAFGTAPVSGGTEAGPQTIISTVTTGHHADFDRVVFTFNGRLPHYDVSYVSQVRSDPADQPVTLLGSAFLRVVIRPTSTVTHAPQGTLTPNFPMLKQVKGAGDFEAVTSYGIGAASRSGFRVFTLTGPNRLVVDLAIPAGSSAGAASGSTSGGTTSGSTSTGGNVSSVAGSLASTGSPHTVALILGASALITLGAAGLWLTRRAMLTTA